MTKNNSISFVIPAYNCSSTIIEAISSIMNGNFQSGDEIIVVNDASTDNTQKVVENLNNSNIKLLKHNYNKGSAGAGRNTAIDNSKNELIFCLDSDNLLLPFSVPQLKDFMYKKGADAAAFGEMHFFQKNINQITHKWIYNERINVFDAINNTKKTPCGSGNYLFKKSTWMNAGRYNESSSTIAFDSLAFGLYQLLTGTKMVTMPGTFYYHRYGYESTYIRSIRKINPSLVMLQILMPFLDLFDDNDVNYITSQEGRYVWFENIENRHLRLKKTSLKKTFRNIFELRKRTKI